MDEGFVDLLRKRAMESNDGILRAPAMSAANEIEWARAELTRLRAERAELVEALSDTTAHLLAATSLAARGGKKAAPSDKMFHMMLADYNASIGRARALLARIGGKHDGA